jgi:hypothetical protein
LGFASVAQLDRASVFGTEGWGFESLRRYSLWPFIASRHGPAKTAGLLLLALVYRIYRDVSGPPQPTIREA